MSSLMRCCARMPKKHGQLALIHFDAHPDTWSDTNKNHYHGNFASYAIEEGLIDPVAAIQIGIRTVAPNPHKIQQLNAEQCLRLGAEGVIAKIKKVIGKRKAYLSIDIDVLDPAFAPGTGTPVPGGIARASFI